MNKIEKSKMLITIKQNIQEYGFHTYFVTGGAIPRYVYTIGLSDRINAELVLAGAIYYMRDDVKRIIDAIYQQIITNNQFESVFTVDDLGSFTLRRVHQSWIGSLMIGVLDYYDTSSVEVYQIVPDETHWTIDIPNLEKEWNATDQPIWKWLIDKWMYSVSSSSTVTTNLDALRGDKVTEAVRWEDDEWEMFAGSGPDVPDEDCRVVPIGTLIAADPSLNIVLDLEIGKGVWREVNEESSWQPWGVTQNDENKL